MERDDHFEGQMPGGAQRHTGPEGANVPAVTPMEAPATSRKTRRRGRRTRMRSRTIAPKRLTKEELRIGAELELPADVKRPETRADCKDGIRPCPWVSCKFHLFLDVNPETGSIKLNFPDLDVWEMRDTCSVDVADRNGITLEEVGEIMNLTPRANPPGRGAWASQAQDRDPGTGTVDPQHAGAGASFDAQW